MRHRQVRHRFAGLALGFGGLLIVTGLLIAQSKEYIRLGGRVIAIESSAGPATIAPPAGPLAVDAGVTTQQLFSVQVSPSSQTWSIAASGDPALALTNGASFVGNASPGYTWTSANPSTTADRTATLDFRFTPGGPVLASLTVIQRKAPAPGAPVLNPPNPLSVSATYCALTGATFAISGTGETSIGSSANAAWITGVGVTSPGPNRTVNYSLLANPNPASRTGAITVTATNAAGSASQTFAVTQSAQPSLALPPGPLVAANANAQSFPVSVTVQSGVVYTASLDVAASVATLLAAGPFTGTGSAQGLAIQFSANPLTAVRPVTLTIATNGGGCTVSASVVVNQPGQPTAVLSRTISFSPSAVNFPAPASSGSVTPLVSVNGVPQSGEAWMVTVSDPDAMVTLQSGTVVPNTQARCGVGALNYSIAQNTDGTKSQREAFLTFFPMAEGAACPSTARADTRPGPVNLLIAQTGPVSAEPTLSVTPSEFSGIPYQGTNSGLRTNVSANRYWDWVWSPSVFMRIGDGSWTPGSAPSWTGFVDGKALPNGDPLPRTDILFINTNNSGSTYAQKVVYFHQNPAPPATQAPSTESISVLDPSNSGGARGRFTLVASDLDGGSTITQGRLRIASGPTGNAACEAYVQKNGGGVYEYFLLSDNGTPTGPLSATVTSLANSQCILNGANSTVNTNGTSLSATFDLQFQLAYRGQPDPNTYNVYGRVKDVTSVDSGWQLRAYQTLAGTPPQLFVSPAQGGPSSRQVFTFDVREAFGDAAISQIYPSVMPPARELPGCSMQFDRASSLIQLYNFDLQTWASVAIAPTMNLVSPLCNIRGVTYTPGALGATMAIDLEFAAGFGGTQDVNGGAGNTYGKYLPNTKLGTWTVPQVAGFNFTGPTGSVAATVGVETTVNLQVTSFGGFQTPVSLQVQGLPGFTSPVFTPSSITGSGAVTLRFTPAGGTTGTYPVTVRATGGAIDKTVTFNLAVAGPAPLPRSLSLNGSATANTDQLSGLSRLTNLTDWRIDTRLHDYSGTTARTTLWTISGSVTVGLDIDPASNVLRLISNTENLTGACTVAYTGRTQLLVRVQRANGGQYSLQLWNSDGSGFAASTPANCNGAAAAQSFDNRLILGGDMYAQPGRAAG